MSGVIDFDAKDFDKFKKALGEHKKLFPYYISDAVKKAQQQAVKELKSETASRGYRSGKKGHLVKNIFQWTNKGPELFSYIGFKSHTFIYKTLAEGATISAKDKYLTFYKDGQWHKVEQVTIAPRGDWAGDVIRNYWASGKAKPIMESELNKKLIKLYDKELRRLNK